MKGNVIHRIGFAVEGYDGRENDNVGYKRVSFDRDDVFFDSDIIDFSSKE